MAPTIGNSTQYKKLTTSDDGRNVMPLEQPKSHFFLEDGVFTQVASQRFGAISADKFNTTSSITLNSSKKVYSICQGTVLIVPQTGSTDKVNLVLKPFKQPIASIPIKYFIYRGLKKNDFVTADNKIAGSASSGTEFAQHIWTEFNQFYDTDNGGTAPDFLSRYIGYDDLGTIHANSTLIDSIYYKVTQYNDLDQTEESPETAYELPTIPRGLVLSEINSGDEIGIDIVLNFGDYISLSDLDLFQFDLAYAKAPKPELDVTGITDDFYKKRQKELATRFIDITAFYGLHANGAGKVYLASDTTPKTRHLGFPH